MQLQRPFIGEDFLLSCDAARRLYHEHAAQQPIIDYHCHLSPADLANDRRFENLTRIWLEGDHYKWRAMRANGIAEDLITGPATDRAKFDAWAATVPMTLGNPLYHWTHLELARPFGIVDRLFSPATADSIWEECNARLAEPAFTARGIARQFRVEVICTTDDPADSLDHHAKIAADSTFETLVLPTFRPDRSLAIHGAEAWNCYLDDGLGAAAGMEIKTFDDLMAALTKRAEFFAARRCRLSDHGLEEPYAEDYSPAVIEATFRAARRGEPVSPTATSAFRSALLLELGRLYHRLGWAQQYHLGPLRNTTTRLLQRIGADAGCDSIGDRPMARTLSRFLDRLDSSGELARTILYNLNPADNAVFATMVGNFQDGTLPGKIQWGSAWWFLDQKRGIEEQLETLALTGLLSRFVGMLTDSRSFLSFPRHDYFRRVLCNMLGRDMEAGLLPMEFDLVGDLVERVCHRNAQEWFGFRP